MNRSVAAIILCASSAACAFAADPRHGTYAGQQDRAISSLSAGDVKAIEAGQGWGLARPAELNGYPGPLHVLELASELRLTKAQRDQVQAVFDRMQAAAMAQGRAFLTNEAQVDALFRSGRAEPEALRAALRQAALSKAALREIHLAAHLATTPLLTPRQRHLYARLRGYTGKGTHTGHAAPSARGSHSGAGSHHGHHN